MALHRLLILFVDSDPGSLPLFEEAIGAKFSEPALHLITGHGADIPLFAATPDFIIADHADGNDPLEQVRLLHRRFPETPILALIPIGCDHIVVALLEAGAEEYLIKTPLVHLRLPLLMTTLLQRKAERQALDVSQQRCQRLFDNAPIGLFRCAANRRLYKRDRPAPRAASSSPCAPDSRSQRLPSAVRSTGNAGSRHRRLAAEAGQHGRVGGENPTGAGA